MANNSGSKGPSNAGRRTSQSGARRQPQPTQTSAVHSLRYVRIVVAVFVMLFVLALVSAFGWPGWAVRTPAKPVAVLRAMPAHVSNFARVQADSTDAWADSNPIEEYKLTYSNGNDKDAVQLTVAQWSDSEKAQGQYTKLTGDLKGSSLANGVVKVNGDVTGNYEVKTAESDDTQATAVWRNDTVVFSVTGTKNSVVSVYQLFPL